MKLKWKSIIIVFSMCLLLLTACNTGEVAEQVIVQESAMQEVKNEETDVINISDTEQEENFEEQVENKIVDYETLGIEEYIYPSEFSLGDNLETAITQLALSFENFDKDTINAEYWKEMFVAKFIQNSRVSFDYLNMISEQNNGQINVDELNYIQYSLTNIEVDFSDYTDDFIDRNNSASALNCGWISGYDYEYTDSGVVITANFEVGYDGSDSMQKREVIVELIKNPYSCFDGYSIASVSSQEVISSLEPDGDVHIFYGMDMQEEESGVFPFEFLYSEDDLEYQHFVYVDVTQSAELADFVRQNAGKDFKVTFMWNEEQTGPVEKVVPIDIAINQ